MQMAWDVFLNGVHIDTVWFSDDMDEWHVLDSLINHDGYHSNIQVFRYFESPEEEGAIMDDMDGDILPETEEDSELD